MALNPNDNAPPGLLKEREAAKLLSLSACTLYRLRKAGKIPALRFGRLVRYDPEALRQWVRNGCT